MPTFDKYIAIDWSGAKGKKTKGYRLKNIAVAECLNGRYAPKIVTPGEALGNGEALWSRCDVFRYIKHIYNSKEKVLVGLDFAFSLPWCDKSSYFPALSNSPTTRNMLWYEINKLCTNDEALYGGSFYNNKKSTYSTYFYNISSKGNNYKDRFRITENTCSIKPETVFKCFGPKQVGPSSVSGMRLLSLIKKKQSSIVIWPFDYILNYSRMIILEIYPSLFHNQSNTKRNKYSNISHINNTMIYYNSRPVNSLYGLYSADMFDALISAAALRYYATCTKNDYFKPQNMTDCARQYEGWIFGVL